jgi:beta-lactamase family protein
MVGLVLALCVVTTARAEPWRPHVRRAIRYANGRSGAIAFAVVGPRGHMYSYRGNVVYPSASVVKAMFLVSYLRRACRRHLTRSEKDTLSPMIRRSDNAAASRIANALGPRPLNRLARLAGMRHFSYTRPWGNTSITADDQARFFYRLGRFIPDRHEAYARYLLSHVVRSQRWGIGEIAPHGWHMYFKGGWGSGTGWVDHQVARLEKDGRRMSVALLVRSSPSHAYGNATLEGLARRLLEPLP